MASYNKVILMGNLTRDPELKHLANSTAVCTFSIAFNETWMKDDKKQEKVSYFDCQAWAKTAEIINEHFLKGHSILIEGTLRQERWENDEGQKRSKVIINVQNVIFLPRSSPQSQPAQSNEPSETAAPF